MSGAYTEAAISEPFRILGRRLHSYKIGHELLLQRFESPFAIEQSSASPPLFEDLTFAVAICSRSPDKAEAFIKSRFVDWLMFLWGMRVRLFSVGRIGAVMLEAMGLFHRYRLRACKTPEFWTSDGGGAGTAVPFVCRLKLSLMEAGSTDKEANETPYALAVWHYLADLESKGRVDIVTDYDRECIEALRSMRGANGTP